MTNVLVTGAAGFIGSNLVDRLLAAGHKVTGYDNLSTGRYAFLEQALDQKGFRLVEGDVLDLPALREAMAGQDFVFHLAANADVRFGTQHPHKDLEQNTIATYNVLEAMRANNVRRIAFSSTGSVYGEPSVFPTPENCPLPVQTSLYGASKLAGEGLISAYCAGFNFQAFIFRFVSILGERYTHGHVYDFYKKLLKTPHQIEVLGNGKQRKSYLYVQDCIDAMFTACGLALPGSVASVKPQTGVNIYNLGTDEYCMVDDSLGWICEHLKLSPQRQYTGGERGWIGDNPFIFLDTAKVRGLGWRPRLSIRQGILRTLEYLQGNPEVLEAQSTTADLRVVVYGLWHLGSVTAACLSNAGITTTGLDNEQLVVDDLNNGRAPLHEPGLNDAIATGIKSGRLSFTTSSTQALKNADVVWVTFDTPVNDNDEADVGQVRKQLEAIVKDIQPGTLVMISSQVPVGFTRSLERDWQHLGLRFACSPENLRLGKALESFRKPERVIVGLSDLRSKPTVAALFEPFCHRLEWMSIESAEMSKHALNAYLATSVTFANELARLSETVGSDAKEVERALKSERRIGPRAYVAPGAAFAGGTLARDVRYLVDFGRRDGVPTPLLTGVLASNDVHKSWALDKVLQLVAETKQATVAVLGLTYKPDTSTLRRSSSVELCLALQKHGLRVQAHDPGVKNLPDDLAAVIHWCNSSKEALTGADVVVLATAWSEYHSLRADDLVKAMRCPRVVDPAHFFAESLGRDGRVTYIATGLKAAG